MSKPLIVYLDSSDYSVFSDDSAKTHEISNIENQLLLLRDEGKIEIRFSHINVIEAAPTKPEDILSSSKRLQTIKRICGNKCVASYVLVLEHEIESLSKHKPNSYQLNILNENGVWFHDFDIKEFSYLAEDIKQEISKLPDRKARRKKEREVFNDDGSVKNASAYLKGSPESFAIEICRKYPILEEDAKLAARSYFNNGSTAKFLQCLSNSLSNLEILSKWYEFSWDEATQLSSFLRELGGDQLILQEQLKDKLIELNNEYELEGLSDSQIKNKINETFGNILNSLPVNVINRLNENHASSFDHKFSWELCPSLLTITTLSVHQAKLNLLTTRKAKISDFGDLFHAAYLPHVDIFRADGNTAEIIKKAKLPFKTKIVSTLTDLPKEIESLLMLKSNNCTID